MNNAFLKIDLLSLILFASVMSGCNKDSALAEQITGTWDVKSLVVDGVESIGASITSMEMDYEALSGSVGNFDWTIFYAQGPFARLVGQWSIDEDNGDLVIMQMDGSTVMVIYSFEATLIDGNLEMEGVMDGKNTYIKAHRK